MPPKSPLTEIKIKSLAPKEKAYKVFDGQGLYLEVMPNGSKKWRLKYRLGGVEKRISLGGYPEVPLKDARLSIAEIKKTIRSGKDPVAERRGSTEDAIEASTSLSFAQITEDWLGRFSPQWSSKTVKKKREHLNNHLLPIIGERPISEITPSEFLNTVLRPIESRGTVETAHRVKMLAGQIFRFAVATGIINIDPTQTLKGALPPAIIKHRASITDPTRIPKLLHDLDTYNGHVVVSYALKLSPLLFVRPGELRHAEWAEINLAEATWRIPAEKMKMKITHIVPLATQAVALFTELRECTGSNKWVFPGLRTGDRPMSDAAVNAALRYLGYDKEDISAHGFRSMASTLLNEQGYNRDWIERQLAHSERDGVRAAYNYAEYLPERRQMMQAWADYLDAQKSEAMNAKN